MFEQDSTFSNMTAEQEQQYFLPATVRAAARVVRRWLDSDESRRVVSVPVQRECALTVLSALSHMPIVLRSNSPEVVVTLNYTNDELGSFTSKYRTALRDYLLVRALNPARYYYDVLGKRNEIDVLASDFDVDWAQGDMDAGVENDDDFWLFDETSGDDVTRVLACIGGEDRVSGEDAAERLGRACDDFLTHNGPFDIDTDEVPTTAWLQVAAPLLSGAGNKRKRDDDDVAK